MRTSLKASDDRIVHVPAGVARLRLLVPQYPSFSAGPNQQKVAECATTFSISPDARRSLTDRFGNHYIEAVWNRPRFTSVAVQTSAAIVLSLHASAGRTVTYPIRRAALPLGLNAYLNPSPEVQCDQPAIRKVAADILRMGATTSESTVVTRVIAWVVDHIDYRADNERFDALSTLRSSSGDCTGYSHLALAILRAMGVPARLAVGISFQQPYSVSSGEHSYSMEDQSLSGSLYHAWIQVYFPGEGWVECDPQGDFGLVDTRRVVFAVAADKDSLPEGRFISTHQPLADPSAFSEDSTASVSIALDEVELAEAPCGPDQGPKKEGVYMARAFEE
jgi:transglutaminase-like putative cysteine protease